MDEKNRSAIVWQRPPPAGEASGAPSVPESPDAAFLADAGGGFMSSGWLVPAVAVAVAALLICAFAGRRDAGCEVGLDGSDGCGGDGGGD